MEINIVQGHQPQLIEAEVNVVIDVIRAFTCAHIAFCRGVKQILLVRNEEDAFRIKEAHRDYLLAGEIKGVGIAGFDLDNSPHRFAHYNLENKTLVQKTTNGVEATLNAIGAQHVFVTGFSNAKTTAEELKRWTNEEPHLRMNIIASHPLHDDDMACAEYMRGIILGSNQPTATEVIERIKGSQAAKKFYDHLKPEFDERDLDFCITEADSGFLMKVNMGLGIPTIERVDR